MPPAIRRRRALWRHSEQRAVKHECGARPCGHTPEHARSQRPSPSPPTSPPSAVCRARRRIKTSAFDSSRQRAVVARARRPGVAARARARAALTAKALPRARRRWRPRRSAAWRVCARSAAPSRAYQPRAAPADARGRGPTRARPQRHQVVVAPSCARIRHPRAVRARVRACSHRARRGGCGRGNGGRARAPPGGLVVVSGHRLRVSARQLAREQRMGGRPEAWRAPHQVNQRGPRPRGSPRRPTLRPNAAGTSGVLKGWTPARN